MKSIHYADFEYMSLNKTEKRIIDYIDKNMMKIKDLSLVELEAELYISKAQIITLCKKIGFKGYKDLKLFLCEDRLEEEIITNKELIPIIEKIEEIDFENIKKLFDKNKKIVCLARGNSYQASRTFTDILTLKGYEVFASSSIGRIDSEIYKTTNERLFVVFSHSGNTISIQKSCRIAKNKGNKLLLITGNKNSSVKDYIDFELNYETYKGSRKYDLSPRIEMQLIINKLLEIL